MRTLANVLFLMLTVSCSTAVQRGPSAMTDSSEPYAWLEEVKGEQALKWVGARNLESQTQMKALKDFKEVERVAKTILLAKDRLPKVVEHAGKLYNFWQDDVHVRGIWRRASLAEFKKKSPKWETILDLDKVAAKEKENWVYKGVDCLEPEYRVCMIRLSRGGGDASVYREFDATKKTFVAAGFVLPEAKSETAWVDANHILVGTDFGADTLTKSGYPRVAKLWTRGTPLTEAVTVFEGKKEDVSVGVSTVFTAQGNKSFVQREVTYFESESYALTAESKLVKIEKPLNADLESWIFDRYILRLKSDWTVGAKVFKTGDLVAVANGSEPTLVFSPNEKQSYMGLALSKDALILNYLDNIQGKLARLYLKEGIWTLEELPFPEKGNLSILSADPFGGDLVVGFENFLIPSSVAFAKVDLKNSAAEIKFETLKRLPARFDSRPFVVQQLWAASKDGTQVPYFVIGKKEMNLNSANPVILYGYGGFDIAVLPNYLGLVGKLWLEKGGTYAVANIRGGGEFGPKWHMAAIKENRQKAYDDFIAVADDMVTRKITSPAHLATSGGSNGGLLVAATLIQRPDLFHAVMCKVPLTDMLRYNKLLAGASWMAEYGNPDEAKDREFLARYSPYQNVKMGVKYPEVFFMTSTMDDRVHPSHARKMAATMYQAGNSVLYFENTEGGHGTSANLLQKVQFTALEYTFLRDRLLKTH